jgi:LuxR family transcriptional regulator, maltose regulon positive regulatory protein
VTRGPLDVASPAPELARALADAKFSAPQPRPGTVSRAGLIEAARSSDRRVVAVTAPAGYGKSTFLAEWAQAEDRRVAWVSLDRFDDDPAILLASLASAYAGADPDSADLVADIQGRGLSALGRAAPWLAAALRASPVRFVLMLDDLHEVPSSACHDVLGMVISGIPRGSQLVAASRSEQPHLPRLRALGEALELGAGDLALDATGAQQIFADARVSLTPELAAAVTGRAEGWPVGLYLAALIARGNHGQAPAVTGEDRYVADYLYREVLTQQPEDMQRFLRRTCVLDQLSARLCDAVVGSSGAAGQLRRLEAASLFVIPLDRQREWYRYHALFGEFLRGELDRTEPGIIMTLHQRAASWYEANGSPSLALEHLLHTTDWDRSVRLAAGLANPTYKAGQLSTNLRRYAAIGDANIEGYPPLAVQRCWDAIYTGDPAGAERWAAVVEAASFDEAPTDGSASFESVRAMLRAGMCARGPEPMMADAAIAVAQEPAWSPIRSEALWLLGEAHLLAGNLDEARGALIEASTAAARADNAETIAICDTGVALLALDRGQWQEAAGQLKRPLATIDTYRLHDYMTCLLTFAAAARLSVHQGDLGEAHRQLARAMRARASATYALPFVAVRLRLQLAKAYLALADPATARQLLREIDDILTHRPALGTLAGEIEEFRRALASNTTAPAAGRLPLTPAELRLLPYLQTHLSARGIAERLFVSQPTVRTHIYSIYRKLGVSSRDEAVQAATAIGLLGA